MLVRERQNNARKGRSGYSLVEILVVMAIIVVLAGVGGYYFLPRLDEAKEDADLTQTKTLTQAAQNYKINNGDWPANLDALTAPQANGGAPYVAPEALQTKSVPGGQYRYDAAGGHNQGMKPDIWVDGPHGQIGNWMLKVQR